MIVFVLKAPDIFDEIERFFQFSNVVVVGADPCQKGIGGDGFGCSLDQAPDDDAMMIGPGRLKGQVLKEGIVEIGKFQELDIGGIPEETFDDRGQAEHQDGREDSPCKSHDEIGNEGHLERISRRSGSKPESESD